MALKFFNF